MEFGMISGESSPRFGNTADGPKLSVRRNMQHNIAAENSASRDSSSVQNVPGQRFVDLNQLYNDAAFQAELDNFEIPGYQNIDNGRYLISTCIPEFVPAKNFPSAILSDVGMTMLNLHLPAVVRMCDWNLLFTIDRDGSSMLTFYERVRGFPETLMLI